MWKVRKEIINQWLINQSSPISYPNNKNQLASEFDNDEFREDLFIVHCPILENEQIKNIKKLQNKKFYLCVLQYIWSEIF